MWQFLVYKALRHSGWTVEVFDGDSLDKTKPLRSDPYSDRVAAAAAAEQVVKDLKAGSLTLLSR